MGISNQHAHDVLRQAELLYSAEQVQAALHKVAQQINANRRDSLDRFSQVMGSMPSVSMAVERSFASRRSTQPRTTAPAPTLMPASIAASPDGKSLWIAAERGRQQWGMELRGHAGETGFNGQKRILFGRFDIAANKFTEIAVPMEGKLAPRDRELLGVAEPHLPLDHDADLHGCRLAERVDSNSEPSSVRRAAAHSV